MNIFLPSIVSMVPATLIVLAVFLVVLRQDRPLSAGSFSPVFTGRGAKLFTKNCIFCHSLDGSFSRDHSSRIWFSKREANGKARPRAVFDRIHCRTSYVQHVGPFIVLPMAAKMTDSEVRDLMVYLMSQHGVVDRKWMDGLPIARSPELPL
jgi:cytochrome c